MPWVRFDDQYPIHRKVKSLSDSAFRLHTETIFWCARNLTDGFVPAEDVTDVTTIRRPHKLISLLVTRGLWVEADGGWQIHDYLEYQPSRSKIEQEREAKTARQARWLAKKKGLSTPWGKVDASQDASIDANPAPPRKKRGGERTTPSVAGRQRAGGAAGDEHKARDSPICRDCGNRINTAYHRNTCATRRPTTDEGERQ